MTDDTLSSSKNETKPRTLRRELVALIVFALVPMLIFSLIVALWGAWLQARSVEARVSNTTSALALAVGREVESWKATLRAAALSRLLDDGDYRGMYARLAPLSIQYDGSFTLIAHNGSQLLNSAVPYGTALGPTPLQHTVESVFRSGTPRLSGLYREGARQENVVALYMPVIRDGETKLVLGVEARAERLARLLSMQPLPPHWRATLLDGDDRVIAQSHGVSQGINPLPDWVALRDRGRSLVEGPGENGRLELVSYEALPEGGWTMAVSVPRAVIDRDSALIVGAMTFGGLTLLLLAIWLSGRVAGRIEGPVRKLAQRAERGFADAMPPSITSVRELQELERAFAHAATLERERAAEREHRLALEVAHRAKDEFLATLSHELRTPLQAALGWLHVLRVAGAEQATRDKAVPVIERNLRQLGQLVDDLVDASRIVAGKVSLRPELLDLAPLVSQTAETWQPAMAKKQQTLHLAIDTEVWVNADRSRMVQVLSNLIANSVKFTPDGGRIEVRLSKHERTAELVVADSGDGIEPSLLPLVFTKFWQAHGGPERRYQGLGLGLAIVKSLVELQGGQVSASSAGTGAGAQFAVQLPLVDAPPLTTVVARVPTLGGTRLEQCTVLLVDDDIDAGGSLARLLQLDGAAVSFVHSASEALAALRTAHFDVMLTDIAMPDVDGIELLRELRECGHGLPVIAATAFASGAQRQRVCAAGFDAVLTKPVDFDALAAAIRNVLQ
jgi:signal transduction histidine kinase/CheY-like chemotaxis protein